MDREKLMQLLQGQMRSTDMWVNEWRRYGDASSVKNAAFALGKVHGIFNLLVSLNGMDTDMPEDIMSRMKEYDQIWSTLK